MPYRVLCYTVFSDPTTVPHYFLTCVSIHYAGAKEEPGLMKFSIIPGVTQNGINYHRITVDDNNTAILVIVQPLDPDHRYAVYLKYEGFPNETYNDWNGEVPREIGPDDNEEMRFSVYPPQNVTSLNGTYRFGLKLKGTYAYNCVSLCSHTRV